ncbi:MAG: phosphatase PAP2 family protein [Planctomycetota bacterium]
MRSCRWVALLLAAALCTGCAGKMTAPPATLADRLLHATPGRDDRSIEPMPHARLAALSTPYDGAPRVHAAAFLADGIEPTDAGSPLRDRPDRPLSEQFRMFGRHFKADHTVDAWQGAFEPTDWLVYGGLTAGSVLVRQHDVSIRKNFDDRRVLGDAAHLDDWLAVGLPLASTVMLYTLPARGEANRYDDLAAWSEMLVGTALMTQGMKTLIHRRRPNGEDDDSFPSMHVSMVAASAFFMDDLYRERYGWKVSLPAYTAVALVGLGRMDRDKHWASDVLAGVAVGYFVENVIFNWHYGDGGVNRRVRVLPVVSDNTVALTAWIRF